MLAFPRIARSKLLLLSSDRPTLRARFPLHGFLETLSAVATVLLLAVIAGCGSGGDNYEKNRTPADGSQPTPTPTPLPDLAIGTRLLRNIYNPEQGGSIVFRAEDISFDFEVSDKGEGPSLDNASIDLVWGCDNSSTTPTPSQEVGSVRPLAPHEHTMTGEIIVNMSKIMGEDPRYALTPVPYGDHCTLTLSVNGNRSLPESDFRNNDWIIEFNLH